MKRLATLFLLLAAVGRAQTPPGMSHLVVNGPLAKAEEVTATVLLPAEGWQVVRGPRVLEEGQGAHWIPFLLSQRSDLRASLGVDPTTNTLPPVPKGVRVFPEVKAFAAKRKVARKGRTSTERVVCYDLSPILGKPFLAFDLWREAPNGKPVPDANLSDLEAGLSDRLANGMEVLVAMVSNTENLIPDRFLPEP